MSKKKSYMDRENILSEGFIKRFLTVFVPYVAVSTLLKNKKMKKLEKDINRHDKNIQDIKKKSDKLFDEFMDELNKQSGKKIKKPDAKKLFDKKFGKK
jgi:mannitol-specific phosphotransferase system IIBC component